MNRTLRTICRSTLPLVAALLAFVVTRPISADDRDILRDSAGKPYLFILLDTSGSMNWSPKCTQAQHDAGICDFVCPTGDCPVPRDGDDPAAKFRQAKEALYEVLKDVDDVDFGFASFNQDNVRVANKHWLYQVDAASPTVTLVSGLQWPVAGSQEVFGATIGCDRGNGDDNEMGCFADSDRAADTNDAWEMTKVRRLPKLNVDRTTSISYYIRDAGQVYYVLTEPPSGAQPYDADVTLRTHVYRCTGSPANNPSNGCNQNSERTEIGYADVTYTLIGDFVMWDYQVSRDPDQGGWFGAQDSSEVGTCEGWDPNDDTDTSSDSSDDDYPDLPGGYNLKRDTNPTPLFDPSGSANDWRFQEGDVIPLVWTRSNKSQILDRLANRLAGGDPATDPEAFANATYLDDYRLVGQDYLRYKLESQRTLFPGGSTPLGYSLKSFREWYRGCENGSCPGFTGWDDIAALNDPKWGCRQRFLLVITDGDDTCPGRDPCSLTASMKALDNIYTYVVAFGVENTAGNRLNCMAANGGTGDPIYPQNKQELVNALNSILGQIREQAASFASAAVPQVQANASDKIYLSSFTPVSGEAYWAGRLDAFLKPLPIDDKGQPDRTVLCDADTQSQCYLWDAGDVQEGLRGGGGNYSPQRLLLQAPHPDDVSTDPPWSSTDLMLGNGANQRRVFYAQWASAGNRRLFTYPTTNAEKYDLWTGLGIPFIVGDATSENVANNRANKAIVTTLLEKEATITVPDPANPSNTIDKPLTYLMGDIFHADPLLLNKPGNFGYYSADPFLGATLCGNSTPEVSPRVSYKYFADRNVCRRTVLFAATNEGQLHAFDAGIPRAIPGRQLECLLPARDLDRDGAAEEDEFADGTIDYDTGDAVVSATNDVIDAKYDNGTGREIFSFIPRAMLPTVLLAAEGADRNRQFWGIDGSPQIDDVFIDTDAIENGSVACEDRRWRTALIGGYREGGPGYYALDVTQPDELDARNAPSPDNGYVPSCIDGGPNCDDREFPSVLWEFKDLQAVELAAGIVQVVRLDEDMNGRPDLANTWSKPVIGRIRVCTGACAAADTEDRFVAIFGGGVEDDPSNPGGNFIYMVDVETGKVIYKKQVLGSVAAPIAAVDSDGDVYLDRLYFGTTGGLVYKVILDPASSPMKLAEQTFYTEVSGSDYDFEAERLIGPTGDEDRYDPFQIFTTNGSAVYHEIAAIYVAKTQQIALAFGTGNRWNLWDAANLDGRFYIILDTGFVDEDRNGVLDAACGGCPMPLNETKYSAIGPDDVFDPQNPVYYLYDPPGEALPGYYLTLNMDEKVITPAFSLAGITIFTAFEPTEVANADGTCSRAGSSRVFLVGTVTALGYNYLSNPDPTGDVIRNRYLTVPQFTTPPFVEQSATKNPEGSSPSTQHADFITETLAAVRDELKSLQQTFCRYANYTQNIKTIRSDTGLVFVAPVPICIDPSTSMEF